MRTTRRKTAARWAVLALVGSAPVLTAARLPHLELDKTAPANGSTVDSLAEIRLWFKEPPMEMGASSVTVRILGPDGKLIATGQAARDASDRKVYSLKLPRGLPPRVYTIAWQAMAEDGDVVRGEFSFTVAAH